MNRLSGALLSLVLFQFSVACEESEFDETRRTPVEDANSEPGEDTSSNQTPTDDIDRSDEKKAFTDYCFDIEDATEPDVALKATVDAILDLTNETLCGAAAAKASRMDPLDLSGYRISDLRPLRNMNGVATLDLSGNSIDDISVLATMKSLENIDLSRNSISSVESLSSLKSLKVLNISSNKFESFTSLSEFTSLRELIADGSAVKDISPLGEISSLQVLDLSNSDMENLNGLSNLSSLRELKVTSSLVEDLSGIATLSSITTFDGSETPLVNEGLANDTNCPSTAASAVVAQFCVDLKAAP